MYTVIMPKQGLQMTEGTITKWIVPVGGKAVEGEPLFEMETDKLTITINSSFTGTLLKIIADEGVTVPITEPIALIGDEGESTDGFVPAPAEAAEKAPKAVQAVPTPEVKPEPEAVPKPAAVPANVGNSRKFVTPRAKMRAAERGIDTSDVIGSGPDGLVIERDIMTYVSKPKVELIRAEKLWISVGFAGAASLVERAGIEYSSFINKIADAALKTEPSLSEVFSGRLAISAVSGADGFEAPPDTIDMVSFSAAVNGDKALFTLIYADAELRGDAVKLLARLKLFAENPELALAV